MRSGRLWKVGLSAVAVVGIGVAVAIPASAETMVAREVQVMSGLSALAYGQETLSAPWEAESTLTVNNIGGTDPARLLKGQGANMVYKVTATPGEVTAGNAQITVTLTNRSARVRNDLSVTIPGLDCFGADSLAPFQTTSYSCTGVSTDGAPIKEHVATIVANGEIGTLPVTAVKMTQGLSGTLQINYSDSDGAQYSLGEMPCSGVRCTIQGEVSVAGKTEGSKQVSFDTTFAGKQIDQASRLVIWGDADTPAPTPDPTTPAPTPDPTTPAPTPDPTTPAPTPDPTTPAPTPDPTTPAPTPDPTTPVQPPVPSASVNDLLVRPAVTLNQVRGWEVKPQLTVNGDSSNNPVSLPRRAKVHSEYVAKLVPGAPLSSNASATVNMFNSAMEPINGVKVTIPGLNCGGPVNVQPFSNASVTCSGKGIDNPIAENKAIISANGVERSVDFKAWEVPSTESAFAVVKYVDTKGQIHKLASLNCKAGNSSCRLSGRAQDLQPYYQNKARIQFFTEVNGKRSGVLSRDIYWGGSVIPTPTPTPTPDPTNPTPNPTTPTSDPWDPWNSGKCQIQGGSLVNYNYSRNFYQGNSSNLISVANIKGDMFSVDTLDSRRMLTAYKTKVTVNAPYGKSHSVLAKPASWWRTVRSNVQMTARTGTYYLTIEQVRPLLGNVAVASGSVNVVCK